MKLINILQAVFIHGKVAADRAAMLSQCKAHQFQDILILWSSQKMKQPKQGF
jgi:hypothetical protein